MKLRKITQLLTEIAPLSLQESYDNAGLIVGKNNWEISGILVCLDATEEVLDEAMENNCNLVIAHHPIVFKGLKQFNGKNYVERVVIKAIKNDIAIYAIHTNLDNVLHNGVNQKIAEKLGLSGLEILQRRPSDLLKLVTYVPKDNLKEVREALFDAGGGHIGNYDKCSFSSMGTGTFRAGENADPHVGKKGNMHQESESRLELVLPRHKQVSVVNALLKAHPYEEVAYDLLELQNKSTLTGAGVVGELPEALKKDDFLAHLKTSMQAHVVKYTHSERDVIKRVAVCGGSGSFLIHAARSSGADAYVTSDIKYHEFFDGENDLMICDIGHYESEQFTIELLGDFLSEKIPNFAVIFTKTVTNPVRYFY
ncbi:MAG: Nif3-like dinuclear metal center hexameric protein [Bacteroidia bacterium]|nr:Nif3-like dinuclear metal center hexameric protein [Bacteroidia bacterium]